MDMSSAKYALNVCREITSPAPALCNEQDFSTMLQKKIVREVNALVIHCPQKELGYEWEGELGQLQRHLNPVAAVSSNSF